MSIGTVSKNLKITLVSFIETINFILFANFSKLSYDLNLFSIIFLNPLDEL